MKVALHIVAPEKQDKRIGLMNPKFVYTPAAQTDIRKTFERIRAQLNSKGKK
jgi:hypothetical protein